MPPTDGQPLELLAGSDGQLECGGGVGYVATVRCGCERRAVSGVDDDIRAAGVRQRSTSRREIAGHDSAHALGLQQEDHRQPDRAATDHDRLGAPANISPADGVPADRQRLGQRRHVGAEAVGNRRHQRLLDEHLFGVGTGSVHRQTDHVDASASSQQRKRDDSRPGGRALAAARPMLGDFATELVAEHDRLIGASETVVADADGKLGPLIAAVTGMQVRAADPAAQHLDSHLPGSGHGLGALGHLELGALADDGFDHRRSRP
jgi:hypothetical protein